MSLYGAGNLVAGIALVFAWIGFLGAMLRSRWKSVSQPSAEKTGAAKRDSKSIVGIALQGLAVSLCWVGPIRFAISLAPEVWFAAILPAAIALLSASLFIWSAQTMGANWSLVARTREDHSLVQGGPFALIRNPIYVALFGMMIAIVLSLGHAINLLLALPLFLIGTLMRVYIEEKLLRATFGAAYDDYARRVKRFIPMIW
jgi:protein-S-isoprenylcysteine O-methyltransferase Ste14